MDDLLIMIDIKKTDTVKTENVMMYDVNKELEKGLDGSPLNEIL